MSQVLTPEELAALTDRKRCDAQRLELDHMGIPYRVRRDGSLAVLWAHVQAMPGATIPPIPPVTPREPELQP